MGEEIKYYPLTHPQKVMWYTEKMHPGTSINNVAATLKIKGKVDFCILEKAVNFVIEQNDGLRLRVIEDENGPRQYISEHVERSFDYFDFSKAESIEELYKWDEQQTHIPFKLIENDLFYFALVKISEDEGGVYGKFHHLISDAWTMSLISNQIMENYCNLREGIGIAKENKPSYIDYLKTEDDYLSSDKYVNDKEYWERKFDRLDNLTVLKARTTKEIQTKSRRKTFVTPTKFNQKLYTYCKEHKTSIFSMFVAGLSLYTNRVTGKDDLVLGTVILNRSNHIEKNTMGMYISTVPLKLEVNDRLDFNVFEKNVSKDMLGVLRHQKYPYEALLKEVREKYKKNDILYDIVLSYQNAKYAKDKYSAEYEARWHFNGYQSNSLMIHINDREDEGNLIIDYDYQTDLYHAKEIEFIHQHIINILWHALDNPEKEVCYLDMLSEREKHKILFEFNNPKVIDTKDKAAYIIPEGSKCYILDKNLNLLPIGIPGGLYLSNQSQMRLGKEYITNPFKANDNIYNTGEIARWYPNGDIELINKKIQPKKFQEMQVSVVSTFTSEPIGDYIKWWCNKFGHNLKITFAGYNQVFQELISTNSMLSKNIDGVNCLLVRFEDYVRNFEGTDKEKLQKLDQVFEELKNAISSFNNNAPLIVPIFPISTHLGLSNIIKNKITEINSTFMEFLLKYKNIYILNLSNLHDLYHIGKIFDSLKDQEGHMPFTDEFYAAVGTEIARKIVAIKKQHFKVIVLDCDDTLWEGICGEQGAQGVVVDGPYRELQELILQKYNEGMLLAICSKNNENDVFEVFDDNPNMILSREHFVNFKINWQEKSENIRQIAKELNLGLDSFIFMDDSTLECSKMVETCPEVLTLQLPSKKEYIPTFLQHVWAFDRVKVTTEDLLRSKTYHAEEKRKEMQEEVISLDDFIKNLELKVSMREICEDEIERASQMTQRTNQFNLSTIRRTEQEIEQLMHDEKTKVFVIEASDKFGDYGLVGLVILKEEPNKLILDTFLLSCRILGRRIENVILSGLRKAAIKQNKKNIEAIFVPTEKNKPIFDFLGGTKWNIAEKQEDYIKYTVSVDELPEDVLNISFHYDKKYNTHKKNEHLSNYFKDINSEVSVAAEENKVMFSEDIDLLDIDMLYKSKHKEYLLPINYFTGKKLTQLLIHENIDYKTNKYVKPRNKTEEKLVGIWAETLKIEKVGIDDDFFEIGGDSLHAIQLQVNLLKYGYSVATQDIYEHRTVRRMAGDINNLDKSNMKKVLKNNSKENLAAKSTKIMIGNINKGNIERTNMFLIGATGYLGAHILDELLTSTKSNIFCLVRGKTDNDAKERLKDTLQFYFGDKYASVIEKRVFIVRGDITLEYFGLKQDEYIKLQQLIDFTIHSGALVNYYGDYSKFEEVNIKGTERSIRFCSEYNRPLIYISTMGVSGQYMVSNTNENETILFTENDLYIGQNYYENPYIRSKFETEVLINNYITKGAKISILRVGNLTGRYTDGHFQKNIDQNAFYNLIKSIISIGAVSKNILSENYDFTPVDYCSKAVVKLCMKNESLGRTFHLFNNNQISVSQIIELFGTLGVSIDCLDKNEFKQLVEAISSDKSRKNILGGIINDFNEENQLKFHTSINLDSSATVSYLKQLDFEWPLIDAEYMKKIMNYMKYVKYIS